jgi:hypothetical protein
LIGIDGYGDMAPLTGFQAIFNHKPLVSSDQTQSIAREFVEQEYRIDSWYILVKNSTVHADIVRLDPNFHGDGRAIRPTGRVIDFGVKLLG